MASHQQIAKTDVFRIEVAVPGKGRTAWDAKPVDIVHVRGDQEWTLKVQRDAREKFPFDYQVCVVPPNLMHGSSWAFKPYERANSNGLLGLSFGDSMGEFDAVLIVRDVRFYAHRAILSAVSPVFLGMFTTENRDKYELEHQVAAEDATPEEFEAFLHSIYPCGKEPIEDFLVPVAILADYYGVKPVLSTCIALIVDNAAIPKFEKLRVAIKTNAAELEDKLISTFTKDDFHQLLQSDVKEHLGEKRLMKVFEKCASLL